MRILFSCLLHWYRTGKRLTMDYTEQELWALELIKKKLRIEFAGNTKEELHTFIRINLPIICELYKVLGQLRLTIAKEESIKRVYIIFHDQTLIDMCIKLPENKEEMLTVWGVGRAKYEKYGERYLDVIDTFLKERPDIRENKINEELVKSINSRNQIDAKHTPINNCKERAGDAWTLEEDAQLDKEYAKGIKVAEIARIHKRTYNAIKSRLKKHEQNSINVLSETQENNGCAGKGPDISKLEKDFSYEGEKGISTFVNQINSQLDIQITHQFLVQVIVQWLKQQGFLEEKYYDEYNKSFNVPTEQGLQLGIRTEEKQNKDGKMFVMTLYGRQAQECIVQNLAVILGPTGNNKE